MSLFQWILLASLLGLVVGAGIYQEGRSRIQTSYTRKYFGAAFFLLMGLAVASIILGW